MSEKIIHPESHKTHESAVHPESHKHAEKHLELAAEQAKKERSELNLDKLREQAKSQAETSKHQQIEQNNDKDKGNPIGSQQSLKATAYEQTLHRVQQRLSKRGKAFSKIVHNKTVESVSNIGAVSVARPSGLLGGSICSFLGSSMLLYSARHYGFHYNFLVFFLLFICGFLIGIALELLIWAVRSRKHNY